MSPSLLNNFVISLIILIFFNIVSLLFTKIACGLNSEIKNSFTFLKITISKAGACKQDRKNNLFSLDSNEETLVNKDTIYLTWQQPREKNEDASDCLILFFFLTYLSLPPLSPTLCTCSTLINHITGKNNVLLNSAKLTVIHLDKKCFKHITMVLSSLRY